VCWRLDHGLRLPGCWPALSRADHLVRRSYVFTSVCVPLLGVLRQNDREMLSHWPLITYVAERSVGRSISCGSIVQLLELDWWRAHAAFLISPSAVHNPLKNTFVSPNAKSAVSVAAAGATAET